MGLVYKKLEKIGRSMYLYFPEQERRTAFKRCSITILRDGEDEASVRYFLDELGMQNSRRNRKSFFHSRIRKTGAGIMIFRRDR